MSDRPADRSGGPQLTFVRAAAFDVTPAIPRALEAAAGLFPRFALLSWARTGKPGDRSELPADVETETFERRSPPRSLRTLYHTALYVAWVVRRLLRSRPDLAQACDFESAFAVAVASMVSRTRLVYDMRDPVAYSYAMPRLMRAILYGFDWAVMSRAAAFVVPAPERVPYLGRWSRRRPVVVVRNSCDDEPDRLRVPASLPARPEREVVRIAYLGYLVDSRGAGWLVDVCEAGDASVEVLAAGVCRSEPLRQRLERSARVHWLGTLPRPEALGLMREADVVSLLYDPAVPVNRMAAPNKFYEALMVGRPVLVSEGMLQAEEVRREEIGLVVRYGDTPGLLEALTTLRDPEVRDALRGRCRDYFVRSCRAEEDRRRYRDFYRSLISGA